MNTLEIFIVSLAVWRLSSLLVIEDGPFDLFSRVRSIVGVKYDEMSNAYGTNVISKMLTCVWCTSIWVSIIVCALVLKFDSWVDILTVLSVSALAILYQEVIQWLVRKQ